MNAVTCANTAFPANGDTHGTFVAGVIGMEKSNGVCGVGVAYNSHITGSILHLVKYCAKYKIQGVLY